MPTPSLLSGTWTLPVLSLCFLICWAMYCRAREATAGITTTPTTSREPNSLTGHGLQQLAQLDDGTFEIPTTSDSTLPGSPTSSSVQAFLQELQRVGPTAGGSAMSPDCLCARKAQLVLDHITANHWRPVAWEQPAALYDVCEVCGPVFWSFKTRAEAVN